MNDPIDALLLTGYLGAGKTTLLQHLLQLPEIVERSPALIINEFGDVGVDGQWFDAGQHPLFEINRGSLFCICTKTDLLAAFQQIAELRPGIVLIEASGVAETRDIESILDEPALAQQLRVLADICVVDAMNFTKVAPFLKATRSQVAAADGLVVNKVDLAAEHSLPPLEELLGQMNPRADRIRVAHGQIPFSFIKQLRHQRVLESLAIAQPESVQADSFTTSCPVDRAAFLAAIKQLGDRLLRLKGNVRFSDCSTIEFVETVCGEVTIRDTDGEQQSTAFTAIAFGLPDGLLRRTFDFLQQDRAI